MIFSLEWASVQGIPFWSSILFLASVFPEKRLICPPGAIIASLMINYQASAQKSVAVISGKLPLLLIPGSSFF